MREDLLLLYDTVKQPASPQKEKQPGSIPAESQICEIIDRCCFAAM